MTLVDADTGEVVAACTPAEARALTDEIKADAERLWSKLLDARDRRAWAALGYGSWREYATAEFGMSQSRAYQLLEAAEVVRALESHARSTFVERPSDPTTAPQLPTNEAQARALSPLKAQPERMADALRNAGPQPTAERIKEAVREIVREEQAKVEQEHEDRQALGDLARMAERAGMDMDADRQAQRGAFARLCNDLSSLPRPRDFLSAQHGYLRPRHRTGAQAAHDWLSELLAEWEEQ